MILKNGLVFIDNREFFKRDISIREGIISDLSSNDVEIVDSSSGGSGISYTSNNGTKISNTSDISDKISDTSDDGTDIMDASDCYVIPGLIDIHFHGCVNHDFSDGTVEALTRIAEYELQNGITSICPATMTLPPETLHRICQNAASFSKFAKESCAELVGINLEGPFISSYKKGAHDSTYIQLPNIALLQSLQAESNGLLKLVSIAPELKGAISCIEELHEQFVFSIAHTMADYDICMRAFKAGASHVTHLFNAMPPFTHRAPGVIGAAFDSSFVKAELICDGLHISPSAVRAAFRLFSEERIVLISDSIRATGMPNGTYTLGGLKTTLHEGKVTLADGTLAGSASNLMDCVRMAVSMEIPLESAVKAATANPAKAIGIYESHGSITPGKIANLILLNKDLSIRNVIFHGKPLFL